MSHEHKNKFRDFDFFVVNPNTPAFERNFSGEVEDSTVATLEVDNIDKHDRIWLSGTLRVDNNSDPVDLSVKIFRGDAATGEEIFRTDLELDSNDPNEASSVLQIPIAHVDVITKEVLESLGDDDVLYTLTLSLESGLEPTPGSVNVDLTGPITFTAVRIKKS
ncbi:hypothetical protein DFP93_103113 [Aneurinibacillus soli]|uniref:Uncharacterized protein n=1 Tax=Aneurinibacillus soli TaxID=1500254 RepID=A0A0U5BLH7_9BACL|nr:hypothetical protein [Aneurinibacillus soli]PYE62904.1 hypothetical protein DFP93_103113 [Aneurinibacillus soli]BAU29038.1 hypothetical protein CB4_03216 [Aneurinibacillus soli]